jgi:hypothetical protein
MEFRIENRTGEDVHLWRIEIVGEVMLHGPNRAKAQIKEVRFGASVVFNGNSIAPRDLKYPWKDRLALFIEMETPRALAITEDFVLLLWFDEETSMVLKPQPSPSNHKEPHVAMLDLLATSSDQKSTST